MAEASNRGQMNFAGNGIFYGGNYSNTEKQTIHNMHMNVYNGSNDAMGALTSHSAPAASHTSETVYDQGTCTPGTREKTLDLIHSLVSSSDSSSPDLIWMHGPAGAGKSAIMRTTAQRLEEEGTLLASFFFFRSEDQRNKSTRFVPTLALQTSLSIPQSKDHIIHSMRKDATIFSKALHLQCLHLLQIPLINLLTSPDVDCGWTPTSPRVIVVDGLDECMDDNGQEKVIKALVQLASAIRANTNRHIKIVVASRPESRIKAEFDRLCTNDGATVIRLDSSDAELHLFYEERFTKIREKYPGLENWPSAQDRKWLMDKTSGQYSFADVSTRHLLGGDPIHRLKVMRQAFIDVERDGNPFEPLDLLYATVFKQLPPEMLQPALFVLHLRLGQGIEWRETTWFVVEPLLNIPEGTLSRLSPHLSSLIDFDNDLRPYHASLGDFLLTPSRSKRFDLDINELLFCETVARGLFAPVVRPRQWSADEMEGFSGVTAALSAKAFLKPCLIAEEVITLLHAVDLSQLDLWAFCYLIKLINEIRSGSFSVGHRHHQGPRFGSKLWFLVTLSLPRQIKAVWQSKLALYGGAGGCPNIIEFTFSLHALLSLRSTNIQILSRNLPQVLRDSEELAHIDATQGWKLLNLDGAHDYTLDFILWTIYDGQDGALSLEHVKNILHMTMKAGNGDQLHPIIAASVQCGEHSAALGSVDVRLCDHCSNGLVDLKGQILNSLASRRGLAILALDPSVFDPICTFVQENELPASLIRMMSDTLMFYLHSWRQTHTSSIASLWKRNLEILCKTLRGKEAELDARKA